MIGVSIVKDYFRPDIDPNTAMSLVTSLAMSDLYYLPPGTVPPMIMPFDPTATMPLALLTVSSQAFDETRLYDVAYFDLRNRLQGITGVIAPGKKAALRFAFRGLKRGFAHFRPALFVKLQSQKVHPPWSLQRPVSCPTRNHFRWWQRKKLARADPAQPRRLPPLMCRLK